MLQRIVRIVEHGTADGGTALVGALPQQFGEPVSVQDFHVVVEQQQVLARSRFPAEVVDSREVEALFRVGDDPQAVVPLLCRFVVGKGRRVGGVVLDDDDLVIVPRRLLPDALQALFQIGGVVLVGDEDADLRVALDVPLHAVGAGEKPILHGAGPAGAGQMVGQRLFCSFGHVGLGLGAAGRRPGVDPPVIEHLGHMGRAAHLLDEPEEEVVVLAAVAGRALTAHGLPQRFPEDGQMADVVAAEQVIRGIIRLEMRHDGPLDGFGEERFVAVKEAVRLSLRPKLQNGLAHGVQRMGGQNVVVVGQRKIFARSKGCGRVRVGRNAPVFDLFVYDALILCLIFLHDPLHPGVFRIGRIGKAKLPIGGRLPKEGIQKFPQVSFRRIIQRRQDGDGR